MNMTVPVASAHPPLRRFRPANPALALGLAVSHLMGKPAFVRLGFGAWSAVLAGQVNRGHYDLVLDTRGRVVGFLGWALTSQANADAWLEGCGFADADAREGDCLVVNAWSADTPAVNRFVLDLAREAMHGCRLMYFRRSYPDGSLRPMRMPVNAFVGRNLGR